MCRRAYDKKIVDKEQPLLLHRPRKRDKLNKDVSFHLFLSLSISLSLSAQAPEEVICLVPELCCMTGLTDYARSDFRIMKASLTPSLTSHTSLISHRT